MPKQKIDKIDDFTCQTVQRYEGSFKRNELLFSRIQKKIQPYISTTGFADKRKGNF